MPAPKEVTKDKDEQYAAEQLLKVFDLKPDSLEKISFGARGLRGVSNGSITIAVPASDKDAFEEKFFAIREKAGLDKKTMPLHDEGYTSQDNGKTPENYLYKIEINRDNFRSRENFDEFLGKLKEAKTQAMDAQKMSMVPDNLRTEMQKYAFAPADKTRLATEQGGSGVNVGGATPSKTTQLG